MYPVTISGPILVDADSAEMIATGARRSEPPGGGVRPGTLDEALNALEGYSVSSTPVAASLSAASALALTSESGKKCVSMVSDGNSKKGQHDSKEVAYYLVCVSEPPAPGSEIFVAAEEKWAELRREWTCIELLKALLTEAHCPAKCEYQFVSPRNVNVAGRGEKWQVSA